MNKSMQRLYEFLEKNTELFAEKRGRQTTLQLSLGLDSSQTVNNWESRGISRNGALKAEQIYGVSANWILHGKGEVKFTSPNKVDKSGISIKEQQLIDLLRRLPSDSLRSEVISFVEFKLNESSEMRDCEASPQKEKRQANGK